MISQWYPNFPCCPNLLRLCRKSLVGNPLGNPHFLTHLGEPGLRSTAQVFLAKMQIMRFTNHISIPGYSLVTNFFPGQILVWFLSIFCRLLQTDNYLCPFEDPGIYIYTQMLHVWCIHIHIYGYIYMIYLPTWLGDLCWANVGIHIPAPWSIWDIIYIIYTYIWLVYKIYIYLCQISYCLPWGLH